jgi:hypothetical protein
MSYIMGITQNVQENTVFTSERDFHTIFSLVVFQTLPNGDADDAARAVALLGLRLLPPP